MESTVEGHWNRHVHAIVGKVLTNLINETKESLFSQHKFNLEESTVNLAGNVCVFLSHGIQITSPGRVV